MSSFNPLSRLRGQAGASLAHILAIGVTMSRSLWQKLWLSSIQTALSRCLHCATKSEKAICALQKLLAVSSSHLPRFERFSSCAHG